MPTINESYNAFWKVLVMNYESESAVKEERASESGRKQERASECATEEEGRQTTVVNLVASNLVASNELTQFDERMWSIVEPYLERLT